MKNFVIAVLFSLNIGVFIAYLKQESETIKAKAAVEDLVSKIKFANSTILKAQDIIKQDSLFYDSKK